MSSLGVQGSVWEGNLDDGAPRGDSVVPGVPTASLHTG